MAICLKAYLPDTPGALIQVLKPISENAGNISSVIHSHEENRGGKVPVIVKFNLPPESEKEKLDHITKELEELAVEITEISRGLKRERIIVILTGHVFETDFVDTMKRINRTGANVVSTYAKFTDVQSISNVKFEILVDEKSIQKTMKELHAICREKNLTIISDR